MASSYTVTDITKYIKNMFEQDFLLGSVSVKGEVSNCKYHSTGHIYFSIKDQKAQLKCVMFAGDRARGLAFRMQDGQQVVITGHIDVFERNGEYQLYAKKIEQDGTGNLYERFLQLKQELLEQGMFDSSYKQPIPTHVRTLGVVTAPTGAAVRDIIQVSKRRNPYLQIILYPALVQGDGAAQSVANGIRALEQFGVDVMIVGRGGGSIEDLWAFNEKIVAEAIFNCSVPIISAVGHETDTTIADLVADLRAPTPSAAAELAVYEADRLFLQISERKDRLARLMEQKILLAKNALERRSLKLQKQDPTVKIREQRMRLIAQEERLVAAMERKITGARHRLDVLISRLQGMSPLEKLNQGFSYTADEAGKTITKVEQVKAGDRIEVYVTDGRIMATVEGTECQNGKNT